MPTQIDEYGSPQLGLDQLLDMMPQVARDLGVPVWLFNSVEEIYDRFDLNGNGLVEEEEARRITWKTLVQKRSEMGGRRKVDVSYSSVESRGYKVVKELGRGGQGTMYLCTKTSWLHTSKYCIKFYEKADANAGGLDELMDEFLLMKDLESPHLAKTYEVFQDRSFYYLVNEPYFGGDLTKLASKAHKQGVNMSEGWWRTVFRQCLEGLVALHKFGVMHCDIKEPNIMIAEDDRYQSPRAVLIDFGLASAFTTTRTGVCGTPGYIPPEVWQTGVWFPRGDVFSLGIVFFQLLTGLVPSKNGTVCGALMGNSQADIAKAAQQRPLPWERFPNNMPLLRELVDRMTDRERTYRLRSQQAVEHPWFQSSSNAELPASTLRSLLGVGTAHSSGEEIIEALAAANNLNQLRQLLRALQQSDPQGQGAVDGQYALSLLVQAGVPSDLTRNCIDRGGGYFVYGSVLNDLIASKERYGYQYVLELFDRLDTDRSGTLNRDELRQLVESQAFDLGPGDADQLMAWMDADHDGCVSFEEFLDVALEYGRINNRTDVAASGGGGLAGFFSNFGWGASTAGAAQPSQLGPRKQSLVQDGYIADVSQTQGPDSYATVGPDSYPTGPAPPPVYSLEDVEIRQPGATTRPGSAPPQVWTLRVAILGAQGTMVPGTTGVCCVCSLLGNANAELFRTEGVSLQGGQASWNIEEDLVDYQPPDGIEFHVYCQPPGGDGSASLLGSASLRSDQFFPLGCSSRLTLVSPGKGICGMLTVKVLVMDGSGAAMSEGPLMEDSVARYPYPGSMQKRNTTYPYLSDGVPAGSRDDKGLHVTWGRSWTETRAPVLAGVRSQVTPINVPQVTAPVISSMNDYAGLVSQVTPMPRPHIAVPVISDVNNYAGPVNSNRAYASSAFSYAGPTNALRSGMTPLPIFPTS